MRGMRRSRAAQEARETVDKVMVMARESAAANGDTWDALDSGARCSYIDQAGKDYWSANGPAPVNNLRDPEGRTIVKCTVQWDGVTYTRRTPRPYRWAFVVRWYRVDGHGGITADAPKATVSWSLTRHGIDQTRAKTIQDQVTYGRSHLVVVATSEPLEATIHYREA